MKSLNTLSLSLIFISLSLNAASQAATADNGSDDTLVNKSVNTPDENTLSYALTQGTIKGLLRYSGQHRDSNLHIVQDSPKNQSVENKKQQYTALGGYLGYETAPLFNVSAGATIYTSQPFGNNPDERIGLGGLYEENGSQESYTVAGEAYIKFQHDSHLIKVGRQEMPNYRFVSLSDVRMTPITHEGVIYENTDFNDVKLNVAYITEMKERNAEKFIDMATGARLTEATGSGKTLIRGNYDASNYDSTGYIGDKKELNLVGLQYNNEKFTLEAWDYYINDFINTLYLFGQYHITPQTSDLAVSFSAQYAQQSDVGDKIAGNIDTWFYGAKLQAIKDNTTLFIGFNEVDYNENSYDGGTIFVRSGTPQMFNSFQVQDSELAGTQSIGAGIQYQFDQRSVIPGVIMRLRYANYDMPNSLYRTDARQDKSETTFDVNYAFTESSHLAGLPIDGLSIQFRLAYNNYDTSYDFAAYKEIHGYETESVTADFLDTRLYLNYHF